jgi:hypothetical protein
MAQEPAELSCAGGACTSSRPQACAELPAKSASFCCTASFEFADGIDADGIDEEAPELFAGAAGVDGLLHPMSKMIVKIKARVLCMAG